MPATRRAVLALSAILALPGIAVADCAPPDTTLGSVLHVVSVAAPGTRDATAKVIASRLTEVDASGAVSVRALDDDRIAVIVPADFDAGPLFRPGNFGFHRVIDTPVDRSRKPGPGELVLRTTDGKQTILVEAAPFIDGHRMVEASAANSEMTGEPVINFRFDAEGARAFGEFSSANIGERLAIVVDGEVLTAPMIREPILGGSGNISGGFTFEEAADLAIVLRVGPLPAPVQVEETRAVGPVRRSAATAERGVMAELPPDAPVAAEEVCAALALLADDAAIQAVDDGGRLIWFAADGGAADSIAMALREGAAGTPPRRIARVGPDLAAGPGGVLRRLKRLLE